MTTRADTDWIGKWYEIADERGVNITASLGQVNVSEESVEWYDFSHATMDGIGGLTKWLREIGFEINEIPKSRETAPPPLLKRPSIFLKGLSNLKKRTIAWKERTDTIKDSVHGFPWTVFTVAETQNIKDKAKAQNVSVNSYMLSIINKILLTELLADQEQVGSWIFPVNMRGAVQRNNELMNQSSGLAIDLNAKSTAQEIHQKIKQELINKSHWSNWWAYHVAKFITKNKMRKLSLNSAMTSFWFGTFSNMGEWPMPGTDKRQGVDTSNEAWLCTPPGTRNYPLSIGVITWYGKMSVTLKVHSSICTDRNRVPKFLEQFRQALLADH